MKEIVKEYTVQGTRYVAEDGKEFTTRKECEAYERDMRHQELVKQIARQKIWFRDDRTREEGLDEITVVRLRTAEEWEAWVGKEPPDGLKGPMVVCTWKVWSEDKGGQWVTEVEEARQLAKAWKAALKDLEDAIEYVLSVNTDAKEDAR